MAECPYCMEGVVEVDDVTWSNGPHGAGFDHTTQAEVCDACNGDWANWHDPDAGAYAVFAWEDDCPEFVCYTDDPVGVVSVLRADFGGLCIEAKRRDLPPPSEEWRAAFARMRSSGHGVAGSVYALRGDR